MFLTMDYGVYFFFASLMVLSVPFIFFLIPETKGIPLERMDELFEVKPTHKAHGIMLERLRDMETVREGGFFEEKAKDAERRESV